MNPTLKNILAIIGGGAIGMFVNMSIIMLSDGVVEMPPGVDPTDMESIKANIHLFEFKHFVFPFLAHALGTLVGAYTGARLAATHKMKIALGIGAFFLVGGIMAIQMMGGPLWFKVLDLLGAYIPMGWLGGTLAGANRSE